MFFESKIDEFRKKIEEVNIFCITADIDWASEYSIEKTINILTSYNLQSTLFATHESQVINSYKDNNLIDLGIHPNFAPGSTQGETIDDIIDYCMNIVPDSKAVRCHRWHSSNDVCDKFVKKGIKYDSNECTLLDSISPYFHRSGMLRFPTYFEDGGYLYHNGNLNFKDVEKKYFDKPGLKVIDIHPMHLMLNTPYFSYMRSIKDELSSAQWNNLDQKDIDKLKYSQNGISDFTMELLEFIKKKNIEVVSLDNLYREIDVRYFENL